MLICHQFFIYSEISSNVLKDPFNENEYIKARKNELMCPRSQARFVINPTENSEDYEINIYDDSEDHTEPIVKASLESICFK